MERVGGGWSPASAPPLLRADRRWRRRPSRAPGWGVWWAAASPLLSPESDAEGYLLPVCACACPLIARWRGVLSDLDNRKLTSRECMQNLYYSISPELQSVLTVLDTIAFVMFADIVYI